MEAAPFLTREAAVRLRDAHGSPLYVYDEAVLRRQARQVLQLPNAYGLTPRYAMKACPTAAVVQVLLDEGLHIDASSGYEVERALRAGAPAERIMLTAQELPANLQELLDKGILFNACSLRQLAAYGAVRPGAEVCVRINPGLGSGHSNRTNVGGPSSSFGIWHGHVEEVQRIAVEHNLTITQMHTHIGSGADPNVWNRCAQLALGIAVQLPEVKTLSLGGGFKVARMPDEKAADLHEIGQIIKADFEAFAEEHGRKLRLEIEPGSYLVANACAILATVTDVVDTGEEGYRFVKCDSGMTEITRPSLYGAQHPMEIAPADGEERPASAYMVVGHCCESGDTLTPAPGNPEGLEPRELYEPRTGDVLVLGGAGAYCSAMSTKNYNSFPEAAEVLLRTDGSEQVIRRRQTLDQILANELSL